MSETRPNIDSREGFPDTPGPEDWEEYREWLDQLNAKLQPNSENAIEEKAPSREDSQGSSPG